MSRLKPSIPMVLAGLCLAVFAGEICLLRREQSRANRACVAVERKKQEHDRLLRLSPTPSSENEKAIAAALEDARQNLATLRDELGGTGIPAATPAGSIEAFFDLNRSVDEMRQRAVDAKIAVNPGEHFGFSSYANEGPAAALVPIVHRQRATATCILEALIEARPLALLAVRRNQPGMAGDDKQILAGEDYFALSPRYSLREPGLVDTDAFRLEFTGQTAVLRQFLNALASSSQTMVVRTVDVEPLRVTPKSSRHADTEAGALHRPQISKFAVTLEIPLIANAGASP